MDHLGGAGVVVVVVLVFVVVVVRQLLPGGGVGGRDGRVDWSCRGPVGVEVRQAQTGEQEEDLSGGMVG